MQSGIYEGRVQHRRYAPLPHVFRYPLYLLYLDLAELDQVFRGRWFWSTHRWTLARFRRADHFGDPNRSLDSAVRDLVEARTGQRPMGPIRLLTQLRHLGFLMNPVSFYYCFDTADQSVEFVVAEVTNTPWGEQHCYVLPFDEARNGVLRCRHDKEFHVSPFMGMTQTYAWRVDSPGPRLSVLIESFQNGSKLFAAALVLRRREIGGYQLARLLCQYPLIPVRIWGGIYWQALLLWWKKCPVFPHPETHAMQEATTR